MKWFQYQELSDMLVFIGQIYLLFSIPSEDTDGQVLQDKVTMSGLTGEHKRFGSWLWVSTTRFHLQLWTLLNNLSDRGTLIYSDTAALSTVTAQNKWVGPSSLPSIVHSNWKKGAG